MDLTDVDDLLRELTRLPTRPAPTVAEIAARGDRRRARRRTTGVAASVAVVAATILLAVLIRPADEADIDTAGPAVTTTPPTDAVEGVDEAITALNAFAFRPSDGTFAGLPLAPEVQLGVDGRITVTQQRDELRDPDAWDVVGSHSPLEPLSRGVDYVVTDGPHETCVGRQTTPPPELAEFRQFSIQPAALEDDSCLSWFAVDVFLDDGGRVVGVTLELWEY